ncbi:hypothetical protein RB195_012987 [Necator americanus]|uniref:Uncharacterized protein n=1 Tax=Necator americanus TaxID=51031 RepID=A0ABR1DU65_NECAM
MSMCGTSTVGIFVKAKSKINSVNCKLTPPIRPRGFRIETLPLGGVRELVEVFDSVADKEFRISYQEIVLQKELILCDRCIEVGPSSDEGGLAHGVQLK